MLLSKVLPMVRNVIIIAKAILKAREQHSLGLFVLKLDQGKVDAAILQGKYIQNENIPSTSNKNLPLSLFKKGAAARKLQSARPEKLL